MNSDSPLNVWTIGPYRVELIDLGRFRMDGGGLFGVVPKVLWQRVYPHVDEMNRLDLATRVLLVRGNGVVMVADAGLGDKLSEKVSDIFDVRQRPNAVVEALAERGVGPEDVTHFVFTHLHFDHAGGAACVGEGGRLRPVFPKAMHLVQSSQLGWANNPSDKDKASYDPQNWEAVVDAGLMKELEGNFSPMPGIELRVVHGHTPGLQMVLVQDGDGAGFLYSVDLFPTAAHIKPHYVAAFDNHPLATIEEKRVYLEELEARRWVVGFGHDAVMPAGRLVRDERGALVVVAG